MNPETILTHYLICALWSSQGDDQEPLDNTYDLEDICPKCNAATLEEIQGFIDDEDIKTLLVCSGLSDEQIGHDIWLTRNGLGSGFWDRGLGPVGDKLSDHACALGSSDAYEGGDGLIYLT